jgi:hypothetical protein
MYDFIDLRDILHAKKLLVIQGFTNGLWTPNEAINQRNLKNWADVGRTQKFGSGS